MGEITAELCEQWIEAVQENGYRYGDELIAILRSHAKAIRECAEIAGRAFEPNEPSQGEQRTAERLLTILRGQQP